MAGDHGLDVARWHLLAPELSEFLRPYDDLAGSLRWRGTITGGGGHVIAHPGFGEAVGQLLRTPRPTAQSRIPGAGGMAYNPYYICDTRRLGACAAGPSVRESSFS